MDDAKSLQEIPDSQLLAYLENSAPPAVVQQIESSEKHKERAKELAYEQNSLKQRLFRQNCPDATTLGKYYLKHLPTADSKHIKHHLRRCPYCIRELAIYNDFLINNEVTKPSFITQFKIFIGRILPEFDNKGLAEQGSMQLMFRGDDNSPSPTTIYKTDNNVQVVLSIFPAKNNRKTVKGLLIGTPKGVFEVHLWLQDSHMASFSIEPANKTNPAAGRNFSFDNLQEGTYELFIKGPDLLVHIQSFVV